MNELQRAELEIFRAFDSVCNELKLPYFLVCGSALGAVKYQGFIPWDDDLDVGMLREDYETFCEKAPALLPDHLFLQNAKSDPAFPQIYSKLRDSRTTYVEAATAHLEMHHGIYIDVFPLDYYPAEEKKQRLFELKKRVYSAMLLSAAEFERSARARVLCRILRFFGIHRRTDAVVRRYTRAIRKDADASSGILCNHGNWQGKLEYSPTAVYANGKDAVFEGIPVRVPAEYDAYLTQKYGAWREELPEEKRVGHHTYAVCDTRKAYTHYRKQ